MIKIYTKIYRKLLYNTKLKMLRFIINKLDNDTIKLIRRKKQIESEK